MFSTETEIREWLDKCEITNYTINPNLVVDVNGDVTLPRRDVMPMDCLPVKFGVINGSFIAIHNNYKDFTGFPDIVNLMLSVNGSDIQTMTNVPLDCGRGYAEKTPWATVFSFHNTPFERKLKFRDPSALTEFSEYNKRVKAYFAKMTTVE